MGVHSDGGMRPVSAPSLLTLQGNALPPFYYYKGMPSLPSNIKRE